MLESRDAQFDFEVSFLTFGNVDKLLTWLYPTNNNMFFYNLKLCPFNPIYSELLLFSVGHIGLA